MEGRSFSNYLRSSLTNFQTRLTITFQNRQGSVVLDQIRTVDKSRLRQKLGLVQNEEYQSIAKILIEMFAV
ncbi:MAG: type II toxin-antitoxin system PemK/MazF family toxin [Cyanobacteria bacterium J06621_12]